MHQSNYVYHHGEQALHGFLTYDDTETSPRPAVLVVHDWSGRNEFACQKAAMLAQLGYVAFAVDMYGEARLGASLDEKKALMTPLMNNRLLLRERMQAAFDAVASLAVVDEQAIAAMGFCFGGLCVLDLARSGANLSAAVSFHGLLNNDEQLPSETIKAKVLALHGYDDPMVSPAQVNAFCEEMSKAGVDWQVHMYGLTKHAFTNPMAHDETLGTIYNPQAESRAMESALTFLEESLT